MKILFTGYFFHEYSGSQMHICEVGEYLVKQGHEVCIAVSRLSDEIKKFANDRGINIYRAIDFPEGTTWDIGICYHYPLLPLLRERNVHIDKVVFGGLSSLPSVTLETPSLLLDDNIVVGVGEKWKSFYSSEYQVNPDRLYVLGNLAPDRLFEITRDNRKELRKVTIVSNHIPAEVVLAAQLLGKAGVETVFVGAEGRQVAITPYYLENTDSDVFVTIGKTVQYCMAAGIPVYEYDRFGGCGYITPDNFKEEAEFIFSGRTTNRKLSAEAIAKELVEGYQEATEFTRDLRNLARQSYLLSAKVNEMLEVIEKDEYSSCGVSVSQELYSRQIAWLEKETENLYVSMRYWERETQRVIQEKEDITKKMEILCQDKQKEIDHIRNSSFWRMTLPLQKLIDRIRGN